MIPAQFQAIANHLWQSTLFAAVAGLLTLALKNNAARTRYWLWFAASAKFLVPFYILALAGSHFRPIAPAAPVPPPLTIVIEQAAQPFANSAPATMIPPTSASSLDLIPATLAAVWATGSALVIAVWWKRSRVIRSALREALPLDLPIPAGITTVSSPAILEPGVFGVWRPVLMLPEGILNHLSSLELDAILEHELSHIRRRDNLGTAIHMLVEALFWFHPLVWWLGARLLEERERACDEEVLRTGCEPQVYAEGMLKICDLYLASPLPCVSGVTGSNLKGRIEAIMSNRAAPGLNLGKKVVLTVVGSAALMAPIIGGFMSGPLVRAQSPQVTSEFEVASIKPLRGGGGGPIDTIQLNFGMANARASTRGRFGTDLPLGTLIELAYGVKQVQILGAPSWAHSDLYRIDAKASSDATFEQMRPMLQSLLTDRFKLKVRREMREATVYELVIAKGGPRIEPAKKESCLTVDPNGPPPPLGSKICGGFTRGMMSNAPEQRDHLQGFGIPMPALIEFLSDEVGRTVIDKTGLTGMFDVQLEFVPGKTLASSLLVAPVGDHGTPTSPATFSGPSIFTALQEQLGLRLEPAKGSMEFLVVDHVERPSTN